MPNTRLEVVCCVDANFALPLAVTLSSLQRAMSDSAVAVRAHILHSGLSDQAVARIARPVNGIDLRWYRVADASVAGAHFPPWIASATLYRLLLGELLAPEIKRVLYLDADTVVRAPLDDALTIDLGGHVVAAVRDGGDPWAARKQNPCWRELGLRPSSPYFNAGVLLIDVDGWRTQAVGERCLDLLRRVKPFFADQDALNAVLEGRWLELPRRWNLQTVDLRGGPSWALAPDDAADAVAAPLVVHFTEYDKPWRAGSTHPLAPLWFDVVDQTDWAGWRPRPRDGSPLVNRLFDIARKARGRRDARLAAGPVG